MTRDQSVVASPPGSDARDWRRIAGVASIGYGVLSVVSSTIQAILVNFAVTTPADLLDDVARSRALWVAAQAILIGQQELLVVILVGLLATIGRPRPDTVVALVQLVIAVFLYIFSGIFHGVLGVHLAPLDVLTGSAREDVVRHAETVHALGDTTYFIATAATAVAMIALAPTIRRSRWLPSGLATLGLAAAVAELAEFGWFLVPGLGYTAPLGLILQACWYAWLGCCLWRRPDSVPTEP